MKKKNMRERDKEKRGKEIGRVVGREREGRREEGKVGGMEEV